MTGHGVHAGEAALNIGMIPDAGATQVSVQEKAPLKAYLTKAPGREVKWSARPTSAHFAPEHRHDFPSAMISSIGLRVYENVMAGALRTIRTMPTTGEMAFLSAFGTETECGPIA